MALLCSQQAEHLESVCSHHLSQVVRKSSKIQKKNFFFPDINEAAVKGRPPEITGTHGISVLFEVRCFLERQAFSQVLQILAFLMMKLMGTSLLFPIWYQQSSTSRSQQRGRRASLGGHSWPLLWEERLCTLPSDILFYPPLYISFCNFIHDLLWPLAVFDIFWYKSLTLNKGNFKKASASKLNICTGKADFIVKWKKQEDCLALSLESPPQIQIIKRGISFCLDTTVLHVFLFKIPRSFIQLFWVISLYVFPLEKIFLPTVCQPKLHHKDAVRHAVAAESTLQTPAGCNISTQSGITIQQHVLELQC